jgi:phosphatidylglycerophosphatase A
MARFSVTNIFKNKSSRPIPPIPADIWRKPLYFAAFGLGSGAMPFAPGTFGTLLAIPFYLLLEPLPLNAYILFVIFFILVSSWISERVSQEIREHDHPGVCIDEFAGYFVTMINAPHGWIWVILGFLLFRFFDIVKPWPIRDVDEKLHNGFGMVMDDVIAGLMSLVVMQILRLIF